MSDIAEIQPHQLEELYIALVSYLGNEFDITTKVTKFTMYESIRSKFITGECTIVDNSAMFSTVPIIGQEQIYINAKFKGTNIEHGFRVTEILDAKEINTNLGAYVLTFVAEKQFKNVTSVFSRSFKGRNTDIISKIHNTFLEQDVDVQSTGGSSHQVVFPFVTPYEAIDMVLTSTFGNDNSPLFLYDTVINPGAKLKSLGDMFNTDEEPIELKNISHINTDATGQSLRDLPDRVSNVEEQVIKAGYPLLSNLTEGSLAADICTFDLTTKTYTESVFDYEKSAPHLNSTLKDYIDPAFSINNIRPSQMAKSAHVYRLTDSKAYSSVDVGNLHQVSSDSLVSMMSYANRMNNQAILAVVDTVPNLECGKLVNLTFNKMTPNLSSEEDIDQVNSGTYLCSAIKHEIRAGKYTMYIEAIRNGINKEAIV
jgi:hypothetical protein